MIPRTIHYCWFGGGEKTELMQNCIVSWGMFCPDFEIVEWNETDFPSRRMPSYMKSALRHEKWAFASYYARLKILYENGGVYFDTDVELLKPIDDLVLQNKGFVGFDFDGRNINTGLGIGAARGDPILKEILDFYDELCFEKPDGSLFMLANTFICTPIFIKHGLMQNNTMQTVGNFTVFPKEYFCPKSFSYDRSLQELTISPETYSIHHYALSWLGGSDERDYCEASEKEWVDTVNKLKGVSMISNY